MKPLTILHIIDSLALGGTELQLVRTLRRLDPKGFRRVLCLLRWMEHSTLQALEDRIETHTLGLTVKNDYVQGVTRLRALIRQIEPDLLHTYLFRATIVGRTAGRLTGRPVITTLANTPYETLWNVDDPGLNPWKVKAVRAIDAATASWSAQYVANSEAVKVSAMRHLSIPEARITVIPRGIAWENLPAAAPEDGQAMRAELGLIDADPLLVNVGRLVPQKGLRYLIDAMEIVVKAFPGARLAIAGEGRFRASLERQIQARGLRGAVRLLGERRDVPRLLAAADLFVFPSLSEGFPNALLEAMAYGKACIASGIEAVRELTGDEGAVLVPPMSPLAMAEAILALARSPQRRRQLGEAAHVRARRFDLQDSVRRLEGVYRTVAEREGVAGAMGRRRSPMMATSLSGVALHARQFLKWARVPVWLLTHDRQPGVVILMYHCVGGGTSLEIDIPADLLARQLTFLNDRYRIVTLDDLITIAGREAAAARGGGATRGDSLLVLTFDDGHSGIYSTLFPLLLRFNIPATVYLPTAYVEEQRAFDWGGYGRLPEARRPRPMTWAQIRELQASGLVTVGAHTHSHLDLSAAPSEVIETELDMSNALLRMRLGTRPRHFSYPYGRTSPAAERLVARAYDSAVVIRSARNVYGAIDLQTLRRVPVPATEGFWFFRAKLGALDAHTSTGFSRARSCEPT